MARRKEGQSKSDGNSLPVLRHHVAGVDLSSREHWVCGPRRANGDPNVRVFSSTTSGLCEIAEWLKAEGVASVAMESTSVYWIPLYELLESHGFEVLLVNARELKTVPGRKTDMRDCQWIQQLHSCGLLRASFRPAEAICSLRGIHRQLVNIVEQRATVIQWMQKSLDQMNIQVHRAVSSISGKTGMAIIRAIVNGERNPLALAELRDQRCKKSKQQIAEYLTGNWRHEHLFNLAQSLELFDHLDQQIVKYETELQKQMQALAPQERQEEHVPKHSKPAKQKEMQRRGDQTQREMLWRFSGVDLTCVDGIGVGAAQTILTEVGYSLEAFPTEKHFVSWLRLSPRVGFSAGKQIRKQSTGASRVTHALILAALALSRTQTALGAYFRKTARRKARGIAVFATARKLAQYVYRLLRYGVEYHDEGAEAFEARHRERRLVSLKESARSLGFALTPCEA